jgi:hypothetical protein
MLRAPLAKAAFGDADRLSNVRSVPPVSTRAQALTTACSATARRDDAEQILARNAALGVITLVAMIAFNALVRLEDVGHILAPNVLLVYIALKTAMSAFP